MDRRERQPGSSDGTCPICGQSADPAYRPFCSRRCADIDLSRWLKGTYAIPGGQPEADEDGAEQAAAGAAADASHAERSHEDE